MDPVPLAIDDLGALIRMRKQCPSGTGDRIAGLILTATDCELDDRLKGLRLNEDTPIRVGGWAFRGLLCLPVIWDAD